jgi:hypothetical protein
MASGHLFSSRSTDPAGQPIGGDVSVAVKGAVCIALVIVLGVGASACGDEITEPAGRLFEAPPDPATTLVPDPSGISTTVAAPSTTVAAPSTTVAVSPTTTERVAIIGVPTSVGGHGSVPGWPGGSWVDPASIGQPWGSVPGVLTFRGSPTRSWHGSGPVPSDPVVAWRYPRDSLMCSLSTVGTDEREWCGVGWTGQPAVFERDGHLWVVFGAYDGQVHFVDGVTGAPRLPPLATGDLVKGSLTVDPDGFPLVYVGSRDDLLRVVAFDRDEPTVLWSLHAEDSGQPLWNSDWDASPLVLDDHLFAAGENSRFHVVRLRRGYDSDGLVTVDPELVWFTHGWDNQLIADAGYNLSIENSPVVIGDTLWFANSGGLVQGWDIAGLADGLRPHRTFRFWVGDDVDATLVPDAEGFLYVAVEYERETERSRELGQLVKLDPSRPDDPVVWSVHARSEAPSGIWATPAVHRDLVVVATDDGEVLGIDRADGSVRWRFGLPRPLWSSPTIVDDVLLMGDCAWAGRMSAFDVSDTSVVPPLLWEVETGACVEASPTVWRGTVYFGSRDGRMYALRDRYGG